MHLLEDEAFVLDARPYGERTLCLTVFTKAHGLLRVMWKGEDRQRPRIGQEVWISVQRKRQGHLGDVTLEGVSEGGLVTLREAQDLRTLFALLLRVLPTGHAYATLYTAIATLRTIEDATRFQEALVAFHFLLLQSVGYALPLRALAQRGEGRDLSLLTMLQGWTPTAALTLPASCDKIMRDQARTFVMRYVQRFLLDAA